MQLFARSEFIIICSRIIFCVVQVFNVIEHNPKLFLRRQKQDEGTQKNQEQQPFTHPVHSSQYQDRYPQVSNVLLDHKAVATSKIYLPYR